MTEQRKNLKKYIIPAMCSQASFFILTIVDGIFVGNGVGTDALGAVSLAMPYVNMVWAITTFFNIGGVAIASVRLGRGDIKGANIAFMHSLSLNIAFFTILTIIGVAFSKEISVILGANEHYKDMVSDYVFWYSLFVLPTAIGPCLNVFARNDGNPKMSLVYSITCTVANIFGDWLMVYHFKTGVAGAAIATGAAYTLGMLTVTPHYIMKKGLLRVCRFKPEFFLYIKTFIRGLPEMISQFANPITTFSMNNILINHIGNNAVNAFSIITYASSLFASLIGGLSTGLQPLYGHSYGEKDYKSLKYYFRSGQILAFMGGALMFASTFFLGKPLCYIYGADAGAAHIVYSSLPKYCLNFVFAALTSVIATYLYSTKRTRYAIPINICRSLILNFACINFLPLVFGYNFIWFTVSVAEGICLLLAFILCRISK